MRWNWQQPDWPNFRWNSDRLAAAEQEFLIGGGMLAGTVKHLGGEEREELQVEAMSTEALTTSRIEGEILNRASVQSSIRQQLGLSTDQRRATPAEKGIAEMMVSLYRSSLAAASQEMLSGWHRMVMAGRRDLVDIGRYRTSKEPMQVISGRFDNPKVHFEAPPSAQVSLEMRRFIEWFNQTAPGNRESLTGLTRAGITHLYFESIHPFEDGNGRIGRALAEKALAQTLGQPTLTALAATILTHQRSYYNALEAANRQNEITDWLAWFAGIVIESQRRTLAVVEFLIDKAKLLDRLKGQLNERQEWALLRMFREGPNGFKGGMSAGKYATITGASAATSTRDMVDLVDKNALLRIGALRHARYHLNIPVRTVKSVTISARGEILES